MTTVPTLDGLTRSELAALIQSLGFPAVHAARVWKHLYRDGVASIDEMDDLPARLRSRLMGETRLTTCESCLETESSDGLTRKFLLRLADGQEIETVLMRGRNRLTACLSSQAGCAVGCVFCATGQMGFSRNLTSGEIVAQARFASRVLREPMSPFAPRKGVLSRSERRQLRNIVLMGMGEPLLNYDAVMRASEILREASGLAIAAKRLTLSTVGVIPGIVRLADERRPCSLAVSLHAANQEERAALVPAAKTWPLDQLIEACRYYTAKLDRKIFFEWTLIAGKSDAPEQARELAQLVCGMPVHINLIPLNPTAGYDGGPARTEAADRFQAVLREQGLPATLRARRGIDIAAGCGQLAGA